ncbi:hypothetical protein E2C01_044310 [Portunus trituberculatus]|uniref:Uncharacterized protein n=1 Tax=Portunus trituberculatus TaxID=210409 RepID=A0A5B7FSS8_PORTR|nr:hypothetical protein [Portunus trituberculatus]
MSGDILGKSPMTALDFDSNNVLNFETEPLTMRCGSGEARVEISGGSFSSKDENGISSVSAIGYLLRLSDLCKKTCSFKVIVTLQRLKQHEDVLQWLESFI